MAKMHHIKSLMVTVFGKSVVISGNELIHLITEL